LNEIYPFQGFRIQTLSSGVSHPNVMPASQLVILSLASIAMLLVDWL
jgi:hypothetical protein